MLPGAIVGAVLAPLSGRMLDSIGPKNRYDWSCIDYFWLVSVGLAIAPDVLWAFIAAHVFYMIGIGCSYSNMMTMGLSKIDQHLAADGNAIFNTLQQFFWRCRNSFSCDNDRPCSKSKSRLYFRNNFRVTNRFILPMGASIASRISNFALLL